MEKFRVEVIVTNKETGNQVSYEKDFDERTDAEDYKQEVLDGMTSHEYSHWKKVVPVIACSCGAEIVCYDFTNTCDCGNDYNFAGQLLASREQWGEETGEDISDCY